MKNWISSLLLALGTCLAGVAAANSERASSELDLPKSGGLEGQYLFQDFGGADSAAGEEAAPLYPRGTPVSAEVVAALRAAGRDTVLVRNPPVGAETVPVDQAVGRVLDADAGELSAGRFLEPADVEELRAAGLESVEVSISSEFTYAGWEDSTLFIGGIVAMILGVVVMRSGSAANIDEESDDHVGPVRMRAMLTTFSERVEELAARVDSLECEAIHTALDPLFLEYGQPFVEHREVLRAAFGGAVFANVLAPFASAERRLNRAWSAAVDGYIEEARLSVHAAVGTLAEAREALPQS